MIYTNLTKKAMILCFEKHQKQLDKSGIPYPFHPFHVAESMPDEATTCVALLHDILEDTDVTCDQLSANGFTKEMIDALKLLTHDASLTYPEYIKRIKQNPLARCVKISDLKHNSDITRLNTITDEDLARLNQYQQALEILGVKSDN